VREEKKNIYKKLFRFIIFNYFINFIKKEMYLLFLILLLFNYLIIEIKSTINNEIFKTKKYELYNLREDKLHFDFYSNYLMLEENKITNNFFKKLSIESFIKNSLYFIERVAGKNNIKINEEKINNDENKKLFEIYLTILNLNEINENENYGFDSDNFFNEFKKFSKDSLLLLFDFIENSNNNFNRQKKFCKIFNFINYWINNKKLLKNKYWMISIENYIIFLPKYVK
jgi:hypothetical protein